MAPWRQLAMIAILSVVAACSEGTPGTGLPPGGEPSAGGSTSPSPAPILPSDLSNPQTALPPSPPPPTTPPTSFDNFETVSDAMWDTQAPHGALTFAATDAQASDHKIAQLTFSGGQTNAAGPGNATQISSKLMLGFGIYRARVDFAKCAAGEELVNGFFTYSHGGTNALPLDGNGNGITDNNEIDIELQCGRATYLWLTSWTDYKDDTSFRKVSRVFDLATGNAYQTPVGKEGTYDVDFKTVVATVPQMAVPALATADVYTEMGFEWRASSLRFYIEIDGVEVTLWNLTDAKVIPQNKAFMMFNLWHTPNNWAPPANNTGTPPASAQSFKVDWFKYWAN